MFLNYKVLIVPCYSRHSDITTYASTVEPVEPGHTFFHTFFSLPCAMYDRDLQCPFAESAALSESIE